MKSRIVFLEILLVLLIPLQGLVYISSQVMYSPVSVPVKTAKYDALANSDISVGPDIQKLPEPGELAKFFSSDFRPAKNDNEVVKMISTNKASENSGNYVDIGTIIDLNNIKWEYIKNTDSGTILKVRTDGTKVKNAHYIVNSSGTKYVEIDGHQYEIHKDSK